jgi:protein-S-isoprenylcysteine O-methyltransferase Ste14
MALTYFQVTAHIPAIATIIDLALICLFGIQHSLMARPWFKSAVMGRMPDAFKRCTYVHAANASLFGLVFFWQPVPTVVYSVASPLRELFWVAFAAGWIVLFLGALSFGIRDLLGIRQMQAWMRGSQAQEPRLKIGLLYRWLRHPMYVGVLLAVWATPRMTIGHLLLAAGLTLMCWSPCATRSGTWWYVLATPTHGGGRSNGRTWSALFDKNYPPGFITTLTQPSLRSRNFLYSSGPSLRRARSVITKVGSICPSSTRCNSLER